MTNSRHHALDLAREALERAHLAALEAKATDLRRALEDATQALDSHEPDLAATLRKAQDDLQSGALIELDKLLERVRLKISPHS